MKAIVYYRYGPPEVLHQAELSKPVPKKSEVLIKVHATTVTTGDWRMRRANPFLIRFINGPFRPVRANILGMELAGEIVETGSAVNFFKPGDRVFGSTGFGMGAYAEYKCLSGKRNLARIPDSVSWEEAAAIPVGGNTALYYLRDRGNIRKNKKVLVYGASGSVGTFGVQLARIFGARVTGVCGTPHVELIRSLGVDKVIDYAKEEFPAADEKYDIIFDAVGKTSKSACKGLMAPGAIFLTVNKGISRGRVENLEFLSALVKTGDLKVVIDRTYRLERIAEAHRYVEQGHKIGNVVISLL